MLVGAAPAVLLRQAALGLEQLALLAGQVQAGVAVALRAEERPAVARSVGPAGPLVAEV